MNFAWVKTMHHLIYILSDINSWFFYRTAVLQSEILLREKKCRCAKHAYIIIIALPWCCYRYKFFLRIIQCFVKCLCFKISAIYFFTRLSE